MDNLPIINCDGCGACCMHMNTPPFYDYAAEETPQWAVEEINAYLDSPDWRDDERPCLWFDEATRKCRHYEIRPHICQDFEVGSLDCIAHRLDRGIPA